MTKKSGISQKTIIGSGIVVVIAAAVIAFTVGGKDSTPSTTTAGGPTTTVAGGVAPAEYQTVTVDGDALPELPQSGNDPAVGMTAPTLSGYTFGGAPTSVTPGNGKPMMVVFLAHWCPHCNREVPRLIEWKNSGLVPADLQVVGVATASSNQGVNWPPSEWVQAVKWPWPVMPDSENGTASVAYGVSGFPFFALIDKDGTVVYRGSGEKEVSEIDNLVRTSLGLA